MLKHLVAQRASRHKAARDRLSVCMWWWWLQDFPLLDGQCRELGHAPGTPGDTEGLLASSSASMAPASFVSQERVCSAYLKHMMALQEHKTASASSATQLDF